MQSTDSIGVPCGQTNIIWSCNDAMRSCPNAPFIHTCRLARTPHMARCDMGPNRTRAAAAVFRCVCVLDREYIGQMHRRLHAESKTLALIRASAPRQIKQKHIGQTTTTTTTKWPLWHSNLRLYSSAWIYGQSINASKYVAYICTFVPLTI